MRNVDRMLLALIVIALICFPSLNYDLTLDGAGTTYFGFPLPWNSRGIAASLEKDIYIVPLVLDLLFWTWIGNFILRSMQRFQTGIVSAIRWAALGLGLAGFCLTVATLFLNETFFYLWPLPGPFHVVAVRLGTGV